MNMRPRHPNRSGLNRRSIIKAIGAASFAAATPRLLRAQNKSDVIVIGAGLSGLAAALLLEETGANVQVIEGRNRIGGRVQSFRNIPGDPGSRRHCVRPGLCAAGRCGPNPRR